MCKIGGFRGVLLLVLVCILATAEGVVAYSYRPGEGITGAAIKKQYNMQWFHISESCNLRAKGVDRDQWCVSGVWEEMEDDFIDLPATSWSGEGLSGQTGMQVTWSMDDATDTTGVTITATIKDKTNDPHPDADDSNVPVTKQMFAYKTKGWLNCTSSQSGSPSTAVVEGESGGPTDIDAQSYSDSVI